MVALSITAAALLAALLCGRTRRADRFDIFDMARHRLDAERKYRDSIHPFED